jgi:hypothetical protein
VILPLAVAVYLSSYGARTPLLALRALARIRTLLLVLVPASALWTLAIVSSTGFLVVPVGMGMLALAVVPAPLAAGDVVTRVGRRGDLAGALTLGTVVLSLAALVSGWLVPTGQLVLAFQLYVFAAVLASALPTVRDAVIVPIRWAGWIAFLVALASVIYAAPSIDVSAMAAAAAMLVVGAATAAIVARLLSRDVIAAISGAGVRDPALGTALAATLGGPDAASVPVVYGVFCLVLAALAYLRR